MSWLNLALGLIREAATTDVGQEILSDMRSGGSKGDPRTAPPSDADRVEQWMRSVEDRLAVSDRNTEMLVRMLNTQDDALVRIQKRQRIWNIALGAAILVLGGMLAWLGLF
jgi:hypothetical protein